LDAAINR